MKPGGKVKLLIDTMKQQPEKLLWTPADCAQVMGTEDSAMSCRLASALRQGWLHKHDLDGRRVAYSLLPQEVGAGEADENAEPFSCKLHDDGDLDLHGLEELENGGFRVRREYAVRLRALLTGELLR
jgi:hypothetical protein